MFVCRTKVRRKNYRAMEKNAASVISTGGAEEEGGTPRPGDSYVQSDRNGGAVLDARQRLGDGVGDFVDHLLVSGMQAAGAALKCSYVEQKFAERIIEPWKKMPLP